MTLNALLEFSFTLQLALAGGYLAYSLAYDSIRQRHRPIDTALLVLVFSLIVTVAYEGGQEFFYWLETPSFISEAGSIGFALVLVMGIAIAWKKSLRTKWLNFLRQKGISGEDGAQTTWMTLIERGDEATAKQLFVRLKSGRRLICMDIRRVESCPFGPFLFGHDGSIAMYVTHVEDPDDEEPFENDNVRNTQWGDLLTYIPAGEIERVQIRYKN